MPRFQYKAVDASGKKLQGEMEAVSQKAAIANLQNAGYLPISAREIGPNRKIQDILVKLFQPRETVQQKEVVVFMGELATLLEAGLPLDHALKTMEGLSQSEPMKKLINAILQRIQGGANLSDAMEAQAPVFNRLQINMIRAGEAGGALYNVIKQLAVYMERMGDLRSTILTAMIYPAILVVIALVSLFVLMSFVVPQFIPLFEDAGSSLPFLTQMIFSFSEFFKHTWWLMVILLAVSAWVAEKQLADPDKRRRFDGWCLRLPVIGELIRQMETARFARTLGTLINNGVPLLTAVSLVREVIGNRVMSNVMNAVASNLEQGQRLAKPLGESNLFPALTVELIQVGEESGNLDEMLMKVADIYDKEIQTGIRRMLTLLEPVLILGLGGMIGVIIISILLAMLGLNELVG